MTGSTTNPLQCTKARLLCAAIVFIAALALYALTLAPTVTLVDSGELIVAARELGVAHPPGFPLYVLLAHLATLVPAGSVAARVNFASGLFAALAAAVLTLVVAEAMIISSQLSSLKSKAEKRSGRSKKAKKQTAPAETEVEEAASPALRWLVAFAPCLAAGLLLAFSRTLWAYATIAEVYALNTLMMLLIFLLMLRWRRVPASPRHTLLYVAAFVFGLALGVHHVTVGLMILALAFLVFSTEGINFFTSKRLLYAALSATAGLLIYVYLPLAASGSPAMNWGDPRTLERFWWHVTGWQYQTFLSFSLKTMTGQAGEFAKLALVEFGPWWMPAGFALIVLGFIRTFKRDRTLFWFLLLVIAGDLLYALNYTIAEDKDAYYLPAFIAMAIAAGSGAEWLIRKARFNRLPASVSRYAIIAIVLLAPVAALAANFAYNNRSRYFIARDYVENIFRTVEPGGMLLTTDWQVYSPMFYLQEIERERTDVVAIDINLLRRSWYYNYLNRAYPQLIEKTRDKVDAFLEDLRRWDRDPELYNRDIALNQRINSRFFDMIIALVSNHIQSAPVYVTLDIAANAAGDNAELTKALKAKYELVPEGLVFHVTADRQFRDTVEPQLITRGLADGAIKFEESDVVKVKVLPVYVNMLVNRGYYLAAHGRHERAIEAFNRVLEIDPENSVAKQSLNESLRKLAR